MKMIAVTFALPAESTEFRALLAERGKSIGNHPIEVLHTGVGENACRKNLASFLQTQNADYLISAGFAGALDDLLRVGDLVLARNLSTLPIARAESVLTEFDTHVGDLHTAQEMIDSIEERKTMAEQTGAVAVDMETNFIAQLCAERGLPMLSLRVITDTPNQPFPAPPDVLFDIANQRTNILKLATYLMIRPQRIPRLISFAKRIERAKEILAEALVALVRDLRF